MTEGTRYLVQVGTMERTFRCRFVSEHLSTELPTHDIDKELKAIYCINDCVLHLCYNIIAFSIFIIVPCIIIIAIIITRVVIITTIVLFTYFSQFTVWPILHHSRKFITDQ